ncbi:penicillin-binding protein 2 [Candidatus Albibeggiatoa sp. nov. BB20]|uniref:penicillin-binding protein 2 n=1 Tax=Candidatus Albibeggiatoa sp. nov. BB20 TaxID=3162723 RepID=UPI0033654499
MKTGFILKNAQLENKLFFNRIIIAWLLVILCFGGVITRLVYLQVIKHQAYSTMSEDNRIKVLPLPPQRGMIYDRNGVQLARNEISYSLEIIPAKVDNMQEVLENLKKIIDIKEEDIERFYKLRRQKRGFEPVPLRFDLSEQEKNHFAVKRYRFPGVNIHSNWRRVYPKNATGVHIIGYVGRINERELKYLDPYEYMGTNYVGKIGVEKFYEKELHGKVGTQKVEVNVQGRILRVLERTPPVRGMDLYLNVDMEFQNYAENLVKKERASIVAIDPRTGAVLALVSMPYYDPNLFVNGIDHKTYGELRDSPNRPMFNRAIRGQYPPGSTVKPFVGLAGLDYGVRTEYSTTWCPGWYRLKDHPHKYRDWKRSGHGHMNLHHAMEQSCDVYFYDLSYDLGIDRLNKFLTRFGFGDKTGIDVYSEVSGLMPSRAWKERARKKMWYPGETLITGIGQGFMLSTPIQLASATATLAMKGQFHQPRVAFALDDATTGEIHIIQGERQADVTLKKQEYWDMVVKSMEAVLYGRLGTARKVGRGSNYRFAGKTGTAQVFTIKQDERYNAKKLDKRLHDHALFVSFAPVDDPQIAVAVIIENGGSGSKTAAPIAKKVMDFYLAKNANIPLPKLKKKRR